MTEAAATSPSRLRALFARPSAAVVLSTALFAAMMAWQIVHRSALTLDELHTLLIARVLLAGEELPFFIGSVSRYEGGSWLVAWPVSWLLRLGAYGSAATCWTAGLLSLATVALSSWWLARTVRPAAGLLLGPLLAVCAPEFVHYSYRAWGSIGEALLVFPIAALAYGSWLRRGRPLAGAVLLGLLLAAAVIVSYLHMVTALLFVALQVMERPVGRSARVATETALVAACAALGFGAWLWLAVPYLGEALTVRGGTSLVATLDNLVLVRLDLIAWNFPQAWMGQHLDRGVVPGAAAVGLSLLSLWSGWVVWQAGGRGRWLVALWLVLLPGLSVGHALADPPDVLRYYVPLLLCSLALIAAAGPRSAVAALAAGLLMWAPQGLPMPYQNPSHSYLELAGNAMYRYSQDPHAKFRLLRQQVAERYQPWFAFGYGLDAGTRYSRERGTMAGALAVWTASGRSPDENPHFVFREAESWLVWPDPEHRPTEAGYFLHGFGVGMLSDGRIDDLEVELLALLDRSRRDQVLEGIGAALVVWLLAGEDLLEDGWNAPLLAADSPGDWVAVGRGAAAVGGGQRPGAADLGLSPGDERDQALTRGRQGRTRLQLREMVQVSVVPTPAPLFR